MESLAEDVLLAAIDPVQGLIRRRSYLKYGLAGAELVMLADSGRIRVAAGQLVPVEADAVPSGDGDLDASLARLAGRRRPVKVRAWVARARGGITKRYLDRLVSTGVIGRRQGGLFRQRWPVIDATRAAAVRAALDRAILRQSGVGQSGAGEQADDATTLAALADAIGRLPHLHRESVRRQSSLIMKVS